MSYEPPISPGDSGEYVTLLQERLQQLGYYEGSVDGHFGDTTETAVQRFQEAFGLEQNGQVQEATWHAINQQDRQLSEDGKWWWDGTDWRPVDAQETAGDAVSGGSQAEVQLSPDGQWQWDGTQWLPVGQDVVQAGLLSTDPAVPGPTVSSTDDALTGFATSSAELTPEHQAVLGRIAADVNAKPLNGGHITLTGGADRRGDSEMNRELAQRRAEAARDYLQQLITDEETKKAIRAYSLGEPSDGPEGDVPSLRRVDIAVTRRGFNAAIDPKSEPWTSMIEVPSVNLAEGHAPKPTIKQADPRHPEWPDWFWKRVEMKPASKEFIGELSAVINETLGTDDLARIGGRIAGFFGLDEADIRRTLDDAFQSGGEKAVKALLQAIIDRTAGPATGKPSSPTGPAVEPKPFPAPQLKTPEIQF